MSSAARLMPDVINDGVNLSVRPPRAAGKRVRSFAAYVRIQIPGREVHQLLHDVRRNLAGPLGFAGDAPERVGGNAAHPRDGVGEELGERVRCTFIGHMVQDLDAPPTDPRIRVRQSLHHGVKGGGRELARSEMGN